MIVCECVFVCLYLFICENEHINIKSIALLKYNLL